MSLTFKALSPRWSRGAIYSTELQKFNARADAILVFIHPSTGIRNKKAGINWIKTK